MGHHKESVGDFDFVCRLKNPVLTMQEVCPTLDQQADDETGPDPAPRPVCEVDTGLDVIQTRFSRN